MFSAESARHVIWKFGIHNHVQGRWSRSYGQYFHAFHLPFIMKRCAIDSVT